MTFLWFVVAVTFFILYLVSKRDTTRDTQSSYDRGYYDGRQALINLITNAFQKNSLSRDAFEKLLNPTPVSVPQEVVSVDEAVVSDAAAVVPDPQPAKPARSKAEQANRNLNILLYTASFLIIAAAAAFIATSMPAPVRLAGLWLVILAFYIVGLLLHARVTYLRPAATAFVGTGLALIPFAGIALAQLGGLSEGWAWCITSIVGLVCYALATVRLNSNIVGYLTIAFSLSLAASTVATVSGPVVLYFVALILVSLVFHLLSYLKASWIPDIFKRPIQQTGHLLTPFTLIGSLLAYDTMTVVSYEVVFWTAALYYIVIWITSRRYVYEVAVRILLSISLLVTLFDVVRFDTTSCLWIWIAILSAQVVYSLVRITLAGQKNRTAETVWYWVIIALLVMSIPYWFAVASMHIGIMIHVSVVLVASIVMAWRLRMVAVAVPALFASALLPFIVGRWPGEEMWSMALLTYIFIALAMGALAIYYLAKNRSVALKQFLQITFWVYAVLGFFVSMAQLSSGAFALSTTTLFAVTFTASYLYRQWRAEIVPILLIIPAVSSLFVAVNVKGEWALVLTIGTVAALYLLLGFAHELTKNVIRRNLAITSALIVGIGLLGAVFAPSDEVKVVAIALALAYSIVCLITRLVNTSSFLQKALTISYVTYPIVALLAAFGLEFGWYALIFGVATFVYAIATYAERSPHYLLLANIALVGLVASLWTWLEFNTDWSVFGVAWVSVAFIYASYLVFIFKLRDDDRYKIQLMTFWAILGALLVIFFWSSGSHGYGAAISGIAVGASLIIHGVVMKRRTFVEIGIYVATIAAQRLIGLSAPGLNIVFYGHWWALTLGLVAYWLRGDTHTKLRLILATAAITVSSGVMALSTGGNYQLLFLVEHVILLVAGALSRTSWLLWWGLAATVLAVLYFLRSSLFLSLLFLGLTLISIVIWRLIRTQQKR